MGFKKMLFGKEEKEIRIIGALVLLIAVIMNLATLFDPPFTDPINNTGDQYYGMPRPDPTRQVNHFNHKENRFVYEDEVVHEAPAKTKPQQRVILRQQRRHRLFDELMREVSDEIRDDIEMDMD